MIDSSKFINIVFVISGLGCGGAEKVLTIIANRFASEGHNVSIITFDSPENRPFFPLQSSIKLFRFNILEDSPNFVFALRKNVQRIRKIRNQIKYLKPDVIVSFMDRTNVLVLLATRFLKIPVLVSERTDPVLCYPGRLWHTARLISYNFACKVIVQTNKVKNRYPFILRRKFVVIPNPVLPPASKHISRADNIIASMGRMTEEKRFDLLIEAFYFVRKKFPELQLEIYGDGPLRENLEQMVSKLEIEDSVRFCGTVKDVDEIFQKISIFVLASRYEGFPNALCEAMANGCAVISTDCPSGPSEIITNLYDGILVPVDDKDALIHAIETLVDNKELRIKLGENAKKTVEKYAPDKIFARWVSIIEKCTDKNSRVKICFMTGTLEPGGTENQIFFLCKYIDRSKFSPFLISLRGGLMREDFESIGIPVIVIGKRFKFDIPAFFRICLNLLKTKPDILQTFMFTSNTWGRIAGLMCRIPVIIASERSTDRWKKKVHFLIDTFLGFFTDVIVCNCSTVKQHYEKKLGYTGRKLIVIPNGVEIESNEKIGKSMSGNKEKIVLAAGRLSTEKGIEYFIKGARIVLDRMKNVRFIIAGRGQLRNELEKLANDYGIKDYVVFTGYRRDVRTLIAFSDVVVLPSLWEGLPNVLLEAMALKKPVVATDVGGVCEIVKNGENGFLVRPACASEIAEKILKILSDERMSLKMGENGYRFVKENFDIIRMVSSYQCLYEKLFTGEKATRRNRKNVWNMRNCKE